MAKRRVNTFNLDEEIKLKLQKANLKTVEDVLSQSFLRLMIQLQLSSSETQSLITELSSACLPSYCKAYDLLGAEFENGIGFGDPKLDQILQGGVKQGSLTELTGPPGVGKTQMCFHLGLKCLVSRQTRNGLCCIDTEGAFRVERLLEMLVQHHPDVQGREDELMTKFHIFQPKTIESLTEILNSLELFCLEHDVGMVVVDSVASLARKEFSLASGLRRAAVLASWAAQLKALAHQLNIAVLITNQVTTRISKGEYSDDDEDGEPSLLKGISPYLKDNEKRGSHVVGPALGGTWTHFVNTRLILQFVDSETRQLIIAKSSISPIAVKNYRITSGGIEFIGELSYTLTGMNPNLHRMKVQPALL